MKKWILILLAAALVVTLVSCASEEKPEDTSNDPKEPDVSGEDGPIAGGWTMNTEFGEVTLPEEVASAMEKLNAEKNGAPFTPVAYLESQVVAGMNYNVLCLDGVDNTLKTVELCVDLDGNVSPGGETKIIVPECLGGELTFENEPVSGGWGCGAAIGAGLSEDVQAKFDKALEGNVGVGYEPLCLLGTQVVAGENFAILCRATPATQDPTPALAVVVVYADLNGGAEILSVNAFNG